ncbi:hypothetical protein BS50DRAFT_671494 [Corynespora cassiicola Philippines]|uniref:Uncharacterized protein n=1 Tax=Corynespora cassiicola Philippines TaxID=1448308 RepID=A0A2T2PCD4_CORCC|nr:hypothetical protein BS50DRAFT_671494 [Corynespora cassiicola Philippines]
MGETGRNRLGRGQCPISEEDIEKYLPYSPFTPYFHWYPGRVEQCWVVTDCLYEASGESLKQQFAATALVMGLVPPTLKDIAWPERRIVPVTQKLKPLAEILVLALGLVPRETGNIHVTKKESISKTRIAKFAWRLSTSRRVFWLTVCIFLVSMSYTGTVFMEIYSKRSALGCSFPVFIAMWHVFALLPASIHTIFARFRRKREAHNVSGQIQSRNDDGMIASAVQGANEDWPVQLAWGIYYITGILVFASIMAVTVVELACWIGLVIAIAGSSKALGFFICLVCEEIENGVDNSGQSQNLGGVGRN